MVFTVIFLFFLLSFGLLLFFFFVCYVFPCNGRVIFCHNLKSTCLYLLIFQSSLYYVLDPTFCFFISLTFCPLPFILSLAYLFCVLLFFFFCLFVSLFAYLSHVPLHAFSCLLLFFHICVTITIRLEKISASSLHFTVYPRGIVFRLLMLNSILFSSHCIFCHSCFDYAIPLLGFH